MKLLALEEIAFLRSLWGTNIQRSERLWKILILNRAKLVLRILASSTTTTRGKNFWDIECDTGFSMKYWDWKDCERWMKRNMEDGNSRFYNFLNGICRNKMLAERQRILRSFVLSFDRDWRGVIILSRPIFIRWINGRSLLGNGIFSGAVYKYSNSILLEKEREKRGVEKVVKISWRVTENFVRRERKEVGVTWQIEFHLHRRNAIMLRK